MKAFEKRFPRKQMNVAADQRTVDFWREKQREGWKEAFEQVLAKINPYESDENNFRAVYEFIKEELEQ